MTVTVYDGDKTAALEAAQTEITALEKLISVTGENSDIYKLDHNGGKPFDVSYETSELLSFALDMNKKTDGALDITLYNVLREWGFTTGDYKVPSDETIEALLENTGCENVDIRENTVTLNNNVSVDLGSVGKGEAGDRVIKVLKENGVSSALLDLGGNIQTLGTKPDGTLWKIAIRDPSGGEGSIAKIEVADRAVITSGGYERYFTGDDGEVYWHILDPKTGRPARNGILSATVIGKSGRLCDALSTSLFVMGEQKAVDYWKNSADAFDMILVTSDGRVLVTKGIYNNFTLYDEYSSALRVEMIE